MVKINADYNDAEAIKEPEGFAPLYGVFKAKIVEVSAPGGGEFTVKTSANNRQFYTAIVKFAYKNAEGEEKTRSTVFNMGLWFPELTKQLLKATGLDCEEGRKSLMEDTDAIIGHDVQITIGATKNDYKVEEFFEKYAVYSTDDGKRGISSDITGVYGPREKVSFDMDFEKELRERFKADNGTATASDLQSGWVDKEEEAPKAAPKF